MAVNKVMRGDGTVLIDVTPTTALPEDVTAGKIFFLANGEMAVGTRSSVAWFTLYEGTGRIVTDNPNYIAINDFYYPIEDGDVWQVTWNNTVYEWPAVYTSEIDGYYIGNMGAIGGQDDGSGATFVLYKRRPTQLVFFTTSPSGYVSLVIKKRVSTT